MAAADESGATIEYLSVRSEHTLTAVRQSLAASGVPLRHDSGKYRWRKGPRSASGDGD